MEFEAGNWYKDDIGFFYFVTKVYYEHVDVRYYTSIKITDEVPMKKSVLSYYNPTKIENKLYRILYGY